jgi:parallel beta-helix repeat protein
VTYDNAAPITVANGGFEQGTGRTVPGWDLSAAPSAAIAPNNFHLWGHQVLQFKNITSTQTIVSDPIAIPTANLEYAATISAHDPGCYTATSISVIDSVTGKVLANTPGSYSGAEVAFTPTTSDAVRLQISVKPTQTDTVELDYASLNVASDYGVIASTAWYYMPSQLANALPNWNQIQPAMAAAQNLTICNGNIVQGQAKGYASLPIFAGNMPGLTVQNVNTRSTGIDTGAVYAAYSSKGLVISGCVFRSTSDKVTNRKSMIGAQVHVDYASGPVTVEGNRFYGSPQVGIFGRNDSNLTISNNIIQSNSIVGDGYGILVDQVDHFVISGNTITAGVGASSRGIMIDGYSGVDAHGEIYGNYVDIRERPNPEYDLNFTTAAFFLRTWQDAGFNNVNVHDNTFIAHTSEGMSYGAAGIRVTMPSNHNGTDLNNVIANNTFEAILEPTGNNKPNSNYYAWAALLQGVGANCCPLFLNNAFESNDISLKLGSGDGPDVLDGDFVSDTFSKSRTGAAVAYSSVAAGYWIGNLHNMRIIDARYANGATPAIEWSGIQPPADGLPRDLALGWLLTVVAGDATGQPLSGATVTVLDDSGSQVFTGLTDASGRLAGIPLATTIYQQSRTNLADITTQNCGPLQVRVSLAGYATATRTINVTHSTTVQFQLSPGGAPGPVDARSNFKARPPSRR